MVISWDIFRFRFSAVLGKKTNITLQIEFSALELCSKHAWGDKSDKVSGLKYVMKYLRSGLAEQRRK